MQSVDQDRPRALAAEVNAHIEALSARFVDRRAVIELVMLGMIAREHLLLIGPPGTGKSAVVQAVAASLRMRAFEYLIGRFTEPSELFGALDLNALKDGHIRPVTTAMLPEAEIAFLDEIFLGSTAILNSLLKILNERIYRRGQFSVATPLICCVAASNSLPDDPALAAFADRFLMTAFVEPVDDDELPRLFRAGWAANTQDAGSTGLNAAVFAELHAVVEAMDLEPIFEPFAHLVRKIRLTGTVLSDRKIVRAQKLIAAAAVLRGQAQAGMEDLWPVTFLVQAKAGQAEVRELLRAELKHSVNPVLSSSVAHATSGRTAHAARLGEQATALLAERPVPPTDALHEVWLVRLETMLARIDAAFDRDSSPQHLRVARTGIETLLESHAKAPPVATGPDAKALADP